MVVGPPSDGDLDRDPTNVMTTEPIPFPEEHTMKRITYLAAAGALVATSGLGAWAADAATSESLSLIHI